MGSREAAVDYMTPLGLAAHHDGTTTHYGPGPWDGGARGRTGTAPITIAPMPTALASTAPPPAATWLAQYNPPLRDEFERRRGNAGDICFWFHHVPWDYKMPSGRTLWDELVAHYRCGVDQVAEMRKTWAGLGAYVDAERFDQVSAFLAIQEHEASGGATPASPISSNMPNGRSRLAMRPNIRSAITRRCRLTPRPTLKPCRAWAFHIR